MSVTSSDASASNPRRRILATAVASTCMEAGFDSADKASLETLTEMVQSFITELGRSSQSYAELSCRTEPLAGDVFMALIDMGINAESLSGFARKPGKVTLPSPSQSVGPTNPRILQAGQKRTHPSHIPSHYPPFPDPHAYIRTPTHKQPITEYYALREKAASQKRDVERALTRFIAKTGDAQALFKDESNLFPLIASKPMSNAYLTALLHKDQSFEEEESGLASKESATKKIKSDNSLTESPSGQKKDDSEVEAIDNPYLRSIKLPKKKSR